MAECSAAVGGSSSLALDVFEVDLLDIKNVYEKKDDDMLCQSFVEMDDARQAKQRFL